MPAATTSSGAAPTSGGLQAPGRHPRRGRRTEVLVIVGVFLVSRAGAYAMGLRFDDRLLHGAYQLLDVRLLRDDPITSIYYLQSQPPLFNVLTALIVRIPNGLVNATLMVLWHLAGLATALLMYATMVRASVRPWLAATFICVFVLMPETLLTESWFFYTQLEMLLFAFSLWGLARFASSQRTKDGIVFTGSLGALVLLRSSFHIAFMIVLIAVVWRLMRLDLRKIAAIGVVPLALAGAWTVKNLAVFDSWSNSSWMGMNISYVAHAGVSGQRCRQLVSEGRVSSLGCVRAFSKPAAYRAQFPHLRHYGVTATDSLFKSTGQPNFNASLYAEVSKQYQRDALRLLRDGGLGAGVRAEAAAYTVWAEPGDDSLQLRRVRAPVAAYADWFDRLVLLRPTATGWNDPARFTANAGRFPLGDALGSISYTLLGLFTLAIYGGVTGSRRRAGMSPTRCVCVVGVVLIAYSVVVGNALDYRENNRFRVEVAPVTLVLGAIGAERLLRRTHPGASGPKADRDASVVPVNPSVGSDATTPG